jgi:hypothetical protein
MDAVEFHCTRCGVPLSTPVRRVPLPQWRTPYCSPYRWYVRRIPYGAYAVSGPRYLLSPANVENTILVADRCTASCCGADGSQGPNRACASCGALVATLVDSCRNWQETQLEPGAVTPVDVRDDARVVECLAPDIAYDDWTGAGLSSEGDADFDWQISQQLSAWAADVFQQSDAGHLFVAEGPAELLRDLPTPYDRPRRPPVRKLPAVRDATRWRAASERAGLTPETPTADRPVVIADLVGRDAPFSPGLSLFRRWCAEKDVPLDGLHVLGIVSNRETQQAGWWRWAEHTAWVGDLPASAVRTVPLDVVLWSFLAKDPADTVRCLARTRWGHRGIAAMTYRDEGPHCPHELANAYGLGGRHYFTP